MKNGNKTRRPREMERKFRMSGAGLGTIPSRLLAASGVSIVQSPDGRGVILEAVLGSEGHHDHMRVADQTDPRTADEIAYGLMGEGYGLAEEMMRNALDRVRS